MNFHPLNVQLYGNRCKILNYYNLNHSPAYKFPKDTRNSWLQKNQCNHLDNPQKTKSNYNYTELYNTREQYIHQSQKITAPSYSFGKAGMEEDQFYIKTKSKDKSNVYKVKSDKSKNIKFGEEDLRGDNNPNINEINIKKNKNEERKQEEPIHQYYEVGKQFVNKSTQKKAPHYSFAAGAFGKKYLTQSRIDNNFKPENDFYNLRKAYKKESNKPRIISYHFGKEKRLDPNIKNKRNYKNYENKKGKIDNNDKDNKNDFKEDANFKKGDNNIFSDEEVEKTNIAKKDNKKEEIKLNISKYQPNDYYNLREHYIYESQKPRVVGYSFGKMSRTTKGKISEETLFYNIREKYVNESQKPKAPNYSFGRPNSAFIYRGKKNENKKRPKSAVYITKEGKNSPGPGNYDITKDFGNDGIKIGISQCGRKYAKNNGVPGPGRYQPNINYIKRQYPIYSIGNAERDGCSYPIYSGIYRKRRNVSYGSQYYRKNPNWIFAKTCKGEDLHNKIIKENFRYI